MFSEFFSKLFFINIAHAGFFDDAISALNGVAGTAGIPIISQDPYYLILNIIDYTAGFLGVIALALIIYGGFVWMTANGEPKSAQKARDIIIQASIGFIIILSAWTILRVVVGFTNTLTQKINSSTESSDTTHMEGTADTE